jgi:hypothetical protein
VVEVSQLHAVRRCVRCCSPSAKNPSPIVAFEAVTRAGRSVDIAVAQAQASAEGGSALPSAAKRVNFSLADVNSLISKLEVLETQFPRIFSSLNPPLPPLNCSHLCSPAQLSGHVQQVPATHTREKCITLTAVSAASTPPPASSSTTTSRLLPPSRLLRR